MRPVEGVGLRGELEGREVVFALGRGANLVGSDPASHVVVEREGVSRRHALLLVEADGLRLIDQGSKNGTFVNGQRVLSAEVTFGDEIGIGPAELRLEAIAADEAELAPQVGEVTMPPVGISPRPSTEVVRRPLDARGERWLRAVRHHAGRLVEPETGGESAPASLVEALGADGCALVELPYEGRPAVLATAGETGGALEALGDRLRGDEGFLCLEEAAVLWRPSRDGRLALVVAGAFAGREESEPLLATLLDLHAALDPAVRRRAGRGGGGDGRRLVFPRGYLPGVSAAARRLHAEMKPLATGDLPVLLVGETGVGKELLARALHLSSPRASAPFVAVNCAAIPEALLEAELFGVGKGVATGVAPRRGRLARADGGTLFLDEIGEMPAGLQAKLLRALQEKEIQPLGEAPVAIDVRVLAATNVDVAARLDDGSFRRDLYYRLAGFVLRVPPLRERPEDVPLLVDGFVRRFATEAGRPVRGVSVAALRALQAYPWPGNVRQLEHEVRRLVHLCPPGQPIRSALLSEEVRGGEVESVGVGTPLPTLDLDELERLAVEEALRRSGGNQSEAARRLGISRFALRRRLERHDL